MSSSSSPHIAVLLDEVVQTFANSGQEGKNGYIVDCTLGFGSHTQALLESNPNIKMICIDQDSDALAYSKEKLAPYADRVSFLQRNFSNIKDVLEDYPVVGILADIGVSSYQLDNEVRGFGFTSNTLDMRMNQQATLSAHEVIHSYSLEELERIFRDYGEIKSYKKVAKIIVDERSKNDIKSNYELSDLLYKNMGYMKKALHPATLVFQAIRIEVNQELEVLNDLLQAIEESQKQEAKIAIISFHSLEDRIVKDHFRNWSKSCICNSDVVRCVCGNNHKKGEVLTKKPIVPTNAEIKTNPRSRSSKMRVFHFGKIKQKYSNQ